MAGPGSSTTAEHGSSKQAPKHHAKPAKPTALEPTAKNYFTEFLKGLGLPVTEANLEALYSVGQLEGWNDRYNPLNAVQPEPGSSSFNSVGVQRYADFNSGVKGAVALFSGSHWDGVRAALKQGNSSQNVLAAFKQAYTWDPNVNFPTPNAAWGNNSIGTNGGTAGSAGAYAAGSTPTTADYAGSLNVASSLLQSVPALNNILKEAIAQGWDVGTFETQIQQTPWWKANSDKAKQLIGLQSQDPAEYASQQNQAKQQVQNLASQLGVQLSSDQIGTLANRYLVDGWDSATLQRKVGKFYAGDGSPEAQAANYQQQLQTLYSNMGLPISQGALDTRVRQLLMGTQTMDTYQEAAKQAAIGMYPSLEAQLNKGMTVKDIADPYVQQMSNILEINPNAITLQDPLIKRALQGSVTTTNGKATATTTPLYNFEDQLRQDPRWQYTDNAHKAGSDALLQISQDFGMGT